MIKTRTSETRILRRTQNPGRDVRIALNRRIQAIFDDESFIALTDEALRVAAADAATGRPGQQSVVANMFFRQLIAIYGSARRVQAELRHGRRWFHYRRQLELLFPDDRRLRFAPVPNTTSATRLRDQTLKPDAARFQAVFRLTAINTAARCGIGCGTGTNLEPAVNNTLLSDGTVLKAASKYTPGTQAFCDTHKMFHDRRSDPDASYNTTGGGEKVFGNKFVIVSAMTGHANEIFMLDVIPVSKTEGTDSEMAALFTSLPSIVEQLPDMQALAFDKALRGTWVTDTWNLGLQPVVSIYDKTGKSTDVIHIKQITFTLPNGKTKPIDVYATGGHAMIRGIASGDDHWIPLHSTKVTFHPNVSGRERAYTHYRVPTGSACHPSHWGATGEIRMNPTGAEGAKIGEHLRALPADDERYAAIYNRRQMTES
ncbi:MAG: hypothetical protein F2772_16800, partial [Actinobacteria bacterium]|nr:hypothetical protein [Actinomycetota bacterium]